MMDPLRPAGSQDVEGRDVASFVCVCPSGPWRVQQMRPSRRAPGGVDDACKVCSLLSLPENTDVVRVQPPRGDNH